MLYEQEGMCSFAHLPDTSGSGYQFVESGIKEKGIFPSLRRYLW